MAPSLLISLSRRGASQAEEDGEFLLLTRFKPSSKSASGVSAWTDAFNKTGGMDWGFAFSRKTNYICFYNIFKPIGHSLAAES